MATPPPIVPLLRGLAAMGRKVLFLEQEAPWYAAEPRPAGSRLLRARLLLVADGSGTAFGPRIADARAVIVGSYVPDGIAVMDLVLGGAGGVTGSTTSTPRSRSRRWTTAMRGLYCRAANPRVGSVFFVYRRTDPGPAGWSVSVPRRPLRAVLRSRRTAMAADGRGLRWDLGYLGTYSPDRQPALDRLLLQPARRLPRMRFVVAGPQYPAGSTGLPTSSGWSMLRRLIMRLSMRASASP